MRRVTVVRRPRVLVIEYDEQVLLYVKEVLEEEGLFVLTARTANDSFKQIEAERPDLVVSTFSMPEPERFRLLEVSQSDSDHASLPVVFMSSEDSSRLQRKWMKAGASGFLRKPFLPDELIATVRGLLAR